MIHCTKKTLATNTILSILVVSFFVLFPFISFAQFIPDFQDDLIITTTPQSPGPNENVTVSVESYSIDLSRSSISWFEGNTLSQKGPSKNFTFTTGSLGSEHTITVAVEGQGGEISTKAIIFRPTSVDILWQTDTYTAPFFSGKALPTVGSSISFYALPYFVNGSGARLNPENLVYKWKRNNNVIEGASGLGKQQYTFSDTKIGRAVVLEVEVSSIDNTLFGSKRTAVTLSDPNILVYENNPLLGLLFNKAVRGIHSLTENETNFVAFPFFMSTPNRSNSNLDFKWSIGRDEVPLGEDKGSVTVSHSGEESGEATLNVSVQNTRDIFQKGAFTFTVLFGESSSPF